MIEIKKPTYKTTDDLRNKPKILFLYIYEFFIFLGLLGLATVIIAFLQRIEPIIVAIPIISFVLMSKPASEDSILDNVMIALKYLILEQQRFKDEDVKQLFDYEIMEDHIVKDGKHIFFFDLKTINLDLTNNTDLKTRINELASVVATSDIEIFSYDKPIDLKANINHKYSILKNNILSAIEEKIMKNIINDYFGLEKDKINSDKHYALKVEFTSAEFERDYLNTIEGKFKDLVKKRLNKRELSEMLQTYIKKDYVKKDDNFELDSAIYPDELNFYYDHVKQDDIFIRTIYLSDYPRDLDAGLLAKLSHAKNTNITIRYNKSSQNAESLLSNFAQKIVYDQNSGNKSDKWFADKNESNVKDFLSSLRDEKRTIIEASVFIQFWAESLKDLDRLEEDINTDLITSGLKKGFDKMIQKDLYFNANPLFLERNKSYTYTLLNSSASALYPLSYISKNDFTGIHLGKIESGSILHVDFFKRNENQLNGNTIFAGTSGGGKSSQMDNVMLQNIEFGTHNYSIDPEGQKGVMFKRVGGLNIDVTSGKYRINPLEIRYTGTGGDEVDEDGNVILDNTMDSVDLEERNLIDNHVSYVLGFLRLLKPKLNEPGNDLIEMYEYYLSGLYKRFSFLSNADVINAKSEDFPIFSDLYNYIDTTEHKLITADDKRRLLLNLTALVGDGSYARVYNGYTNISNHKNINFNIQTLLNNLDMYLQNSCLYNILSYIFSKQIALKNKANIYIDELYLLINKNAIILATYLRDLWKRARKYNLNMYGAIQNLPDLLQEGLKEITMAIFSNSNKKFIFAPGELEDEAIKSAFNFNELVMEKVRGLTAGKFLFCEHNSKYVVDSYEKLLPTVWKIINNEAYSIERSLT